MAAWFLNNTVAAAGLALIVVVACRFGRFRPAVEHALWLLVLVKLLTPAWLAWPWSPWEGLGRVIHQEPAIRSLGEIPESRPLLTAEPPRLPGGTARPTHRGPRVQARVGGFASVSGPATDDPEISAVAASSHRQVPGSPKPTRPNPEPRTPSVSWMDFWVAAVAHGVWRTGGMISHVSLYFWACGAAILLMLQSVQAIRFRRLFIRGEPIRGELAQELGQLAARFGLRPPRARLVSELGSPILWCLGKPALLWPRELTRDLAAGATRSLLLHELAHLRRGDHWVAWLEGIGLLIWWWNPLFWYVRRRLRQSAEMACDAWVVWAVPDARRTYAESLVTVTELASQGRAVVPAWGAIGEARTLERRLIMIFRNDVRRDLPRSGLLVILLLGAVVLPGWSWGGEGGDTPQPPAAKSEPPAASAPIADPPQVPVPAPSAVLPPAALEKPQIPKLPAESKPRARTGRGSEQAGLPGEVVGPPDRPSAGYPTTPTQRPVPLTPGVSYAPAAVASTQPAGPMSIAVFALQRRQPGEMISMIIALWGFNADQTLVVAFAAESDRRGLAETHMGPVHPKVLSGFSAGVGATLPQLAAAEPRSNFLPPTVRPTGAPGATGYLIAQPEYASMPRLAADPQTRSLIARGTAEQIERISQLVTALDASGENLPEQFEKLGSVRPLTPKHRSIREILPILHNLGIPVRDIPIPASDEKADREKPHGTLIAIGPEKDVTDIQRLIESLDVEIDEGQPAQQPADNPFQ